MKKRKFFLIFFSLIFSLTYCLKVYAESLTEEKIKNFTYWLTFEETLVKLKDGKYEAGNKPEDFIKVYIDRFSIQDLDVDGRNEAVAILFSNYGGLVSFYELTALLSKADGFYQTDSIVAAELGGMTEDNVKSDAKTKTKYSFLANDLGLLILRELKLEKHKISIRVNSNGCTDKKTIKANVKKTDGVDRDVSHYEIHFIRTQPDYCKAIFPEGVVIEYDLKGDFGIDTKLPYTVSIKNPVYPLLPDEPYFYFLPKKEEKPKPVIKEDSKLKENLIKATINAIEREKERYEKSQYKDKNEKIEFLRGELDKFKKMIPEEYILKSQSEKEETFLDLGKFGPIMPPIEREVEIVIEKPLDIGSILNVKGMTKSGPFYHLAGKDDRLSDIKPGIYKAKVYLIYKREYFANIPNYYVYLANISEIKK